MKTETEKITCLYGGKGDIQLRHIMPKKEDGKRCRLYAEVMIEPGDSLGFHTHEDEEETYFFLSGEGEYNDNGTKYPVGAGDVAYAPGGCGHALVNTGSEALVFMALTLEL